MLLDIALKEHRLKIYWQDELCGARFVMDDQLSAIALKQAVAGHHQPFQRKRPVHRPFTGKVIRDGLVILPSFGLKFEY